MLFNSSHNSTTNATLNDDPRTFPLGQALYVDATHEVVVLNGVSPCSARTRYILKIDGKQSSPR